MINNYWLLAISLCFGVSMYYLNMWSVPRLQRIFIAKKFELAELKLKYEAQQKIKQSASKKVNQNKDTKDKKKDI